MKINNRYISAIFGLLLALNTLGLSAGEPKASLFRTSFNDKVITLAAPSRVDTDRLIYSVSVAGRPAATTQSYYSVFQTRDLINAIRDNQGINVHWRPDGNACVIEEYVGADSPEGMPIYFSFKNGMAQREEYAIVKEPKRGGPGYTSNLVFVKWLRNGSPLIRQVIAP